MQSARDVRKVNIEEDTDDVGDAGLWCDVEDGDDVGEVAIERFTTLLLVFVEYFDEPCRSDADREGNVEEDGRIKSNAILNDDVGDSTGGVG